MNCLVLTLCFAFVNAGCQKGNAPAVPNKGKYLFDSPADPVNEDSIARMVCRGGYKQDPSLTLKCSDGNWIGDVGECVAQEKLVGASGKLHYEPEAIGEIVSHLTKASFGCQDEYEIKSTTKNGQIVCYADTCIDQYESLSSNDTFLCHFGTWVGRLEHNQCVPIKNNTGTTADCFPTEFKEQCLNITLMPGYKSTYYNGFCWVVNSLDLQDWTTANTTCKADYTNGRLAFITNREELNAIKTVIDFGTGVWCGITRDTSQTEPNGWQYVSSDGARVYAKHPLNEWSTGYPMPGLGDLAAVGMDGYMQQMPHMILLYLCQFPEPPSCPNKASFSVAIEDSKAAASTGNVTIKVLADVNIHRCSHLCAELATCQSFAHNKKIEKCELYWLPVEALTLESAAGFDVFDRTPNYKNCEELQDCFDVCRPAITNASSASYSYRLFRKNANLSVEALL